MKILELIENIPDPRMLGKVKHSLSTVLFVSLCGVLCGCESWEDIKDYCEAKSEWLSKYVSLDNGTPSSYTLRRVFTLLDPDTVEQLLRTHAAEIVSKGKPTNHIAVDGKSLCGSKTLSTKCLCSVSAWCSENNLILGELQTESKSNEITAIPLLLASMDLDGNTVTIDAAGCQKTIASLIIEKQGDYVLGLKRNQPKLYASVEKHINEVGTDSKNCLSDAFDESHGRTVRRRYFGYNVSNLPELTDWIGARTVVAVETISSKNNDVDRKVTAEWRYYLSSHEANNTNLPGYVRNHWSIENKLHWVLDVHLKEDGDQKAERKSARSFALLKRIALNMVRSKDTNPKKSLRRKLKHPAWDNDHLLFILS